MPRRIALLLVLVLSQSLVAWAESSVAPVILIYCPAAPLYGQALRTVIEEDGRFAEARVQVCQRLDEFRAAAFFPDVKAIVVSLARDVGQDLNSTLEWFFNKGGGIVGMGFATMWSASRNASEDVLPIFGNSYGSGTYDPVSRKSFISFIKAEEDEISEGISSFSAAHHRFILHRNLSSGLFEEKRPKSGEYKVLFTEQSTGAPLLVRYRDEGVSVTFATFGGDDIERSQGYFGLFINEPAFRTLFTNSLYWVWTNEQKFQDSVSKAEQFYQHTARTIDSLRRAAEDRERAANLSCLLRNVFAIVGGSLGSIAVYWLTFVRKSPSKRI